MNRETSRVGGQDISYRDAALTHLPTDCTISTELQELISSLGDVLEQKPDGVSLNEARRSCPLLFHSKLLTDHPSVRHLLLSLPHVVRVEGFGVQTRLFPASKKS